MGQYVADAALAYCSASRCLAVVITAASDASSNHLLPAFGFFVLVMLRERWP